MKIPNNIMLHILDKIIIQLREIIRCFCNNFMFYITFVVYFYIYIDIFLYIIFLLYL